MRKLIGMIILMIFLLIYIATAVIIGSRLINADAWVKLIFYAVAGIGWALPLKPLMRWMHANDKPLPSTDV